MATKKEVAELKFTILKLRNELKKSQANEENLGEDARNLERANVKIREKHNNEMNEKNLTLSALERKNIKLEMINEVLVANGDGYNYTIAEQGKKIIELENKEIGSNNAVIIALSNACNNK
tara:strand:+ start:122 stop:484 length:363 start_codon:yes stop_codon:yes gene_type:complete